jgi:hypothetical protein
MLAWRMRASMSLKLDDFAAIVAAMHRRLRPGLIVAVAAAARPKSTPR